MDGYCGKDVWYVGIYVAEKKDVVFLSKMIIFVKVTSKTNLPMKY